MECIFDCFKGAHCGLSSVKLFKCHSVVCASFLVCGRLLKYLILFADDHGFHIIGAGHVRFALFIIDKAHVVIALSKLEGEEIGTRVLIFLSNAQLEGL